MQQSENHPSINGSHTKLEIPPGKAGSYRVSQMDDYSRLSRGKFLHKPPLSLSVQARVSETYLPGTWGIGFWNDPFALGVGIKGSGFRLPAMPEAAWFFYASPKNDLSFRNLEPTNGLLASVFTSPSVPSLIMPFGLPAMPLLASKTSARWLRRIASSLIKEDSARLSFDTTDWHEYGLDWMENRVQFFIDKEMVFESSISPRAPLGLVIWIDNQYAAFSADGSVRFGTEGNPSPAWMEIKNIEILDKHKP